MGKWAPASAGFDRIKPAAPALDELEILGTIPEDPSKPYDMEIIIRRLVDDSQFEEYKAEYGKSILCGYARMRRLGCGHCGQPTQGGQECQRRIAVWRCDLQR